MINKRLKYFIAIIGATFLFSGCAAVNNEVINPTPQEVGSFKQSTTVLEDLYIKQGYVKGEAVGYQKGLEHSKKIISRLMNEIRAKQFSTYLVKERFIEAGPIYMDPITGEIELGRMEIRKPWTIADIFKHFGADLPIKNEDMVNQELRELDNQIEKIQSSVSPDIFVKPVQSQEITQVNANGYFAKLNNTQSNQELLNKFGYKHGAIDDKLIIKFNTNKDKEVFCLNFGCLEN